MLKATARKAAALAFLFAGGTGQTQADDWMTAANDAQRTSWLRSDPKISVEAFKKSEFKLEWKLKPANTVRELNSLMPAAVLNFYIGYRGFRALAFVAASSDRIIAFDTELGRLEWQKDLSQGITSHKSISCPGGVTSGAARPTITAYPSGTGISGSGRGTPAKSGVGLPDEGAITIKRAMPPVSAAPPPQPAATPVPAPTPAPRPAAVVNSPYAPHIQSVLVLSGDGYLHSLWVSNGNEPKPAVKFLPPGADARGLIAFGDTAYVATSHHCAQVEDGIWAVDLTSSEVTHWKPEAGTISGAVGPAAGPDGTLYAATTAGELAALEPKTLKPLAIQKMPGVAFTSSPLVFAFGGKNLIAVGANDGCIYLFDAALLGNANALAKSAPVSAPGFEAGSLTSWVDGARARWILSASNEGVVAWKISANAAALSLEQGWKSAAMVNPAPPIVTNGVVFALSSGEFQAQDGKASLSKRIKGSVNAVLYALDGETGKELWNSGQQITSFVHSGALVGGETRVYLADYDGNQYAFGVPIEH